MGADRGRGHANVQAAIAGRRVVDVSEPGGPVTAGISTGHLLDVASPGDGVIAHLRESKPLVRLRVPFTVSRDGHRRRRARLAGLRLGSGQGRREEAGVCRGPSDLRGLRGASIDGIRACSSNPALALPSDPGRCPTSSPRRCPSCGWRVSTARTRCCCRPTCTRRSARPPSTAIRSASTSTGWSMATSSGRPRSTAHSCCPPAAATSICSWAPTCRSGTCRTTPTTVQLYLQETMTFLCYTAEASVALTP